MGTLLAMMLACAVPEPHFVPVPRFVPVPAFKEPAPTTMPNLIIPTTPTILRYERRCTAEGCVEVPVFSEEPKATEEPGGFRNWRLLRRRR